MLRMLTEQRSLFFYSHQRTEQPTILPFLVFGTLVDHLLTLYAAPEALFRESRVHAANHNKAVPAADIGCNHFIIHKTQIASRHDLADAFAILCACGLPCPFRWSTYQENWREVRSIPRPRPRRGPCGDRCIPHALTSTEFLNLGIGIMETSYAATVTARMRLQQKLMVLSFVSERGGA